MASATHVELWLALLDDDGREVQAADYKRIKVTMVNGMTVGDVTFPTAASDWGQLVYFALFSKETDSIALLTGELRQATQVSLGDTAQMSSLEANEQAMVEVRKALQPAPEPDIHMNPAQRARLRTKANEARRALGALEDDE